MSKMYSEEEKRRYLNANKVSRKNKTKKQSTIYIVYGATDFRKQIYSLCQLVKSKFKLNPYKNEALYFLQKHYQIQMKFQQPRNSNELKEITKQQLI